MEVKDLTVTNAIEIAIRMEIEAINFYTEVSEKTTNPVGKKMFLTIREDEKKHLEFRGSLWATQWLH
jgi:rubrerythrin